MDPTVPLPLFRGYVALRFNGTVAPGPPYSLVLVPLWRLPWPLPISILELGDEGEHVWANDATVVEKNGQYYKSMELWPMTPAHSDHLLGVDH